MNAEARQRLLQNLLPALIAFVAYVWGFAPEPREKVEKLRERLEKLEREPPVSLGAVRKRVGELQRVVAAAKEARREAGKLAAHLRGDSHEDEDRHACEESLIALLAQHGILLEGTGEPPGGFVRPPSLEAVRVAARAAAQPVAPPVRRGRKQRIRRAAPAQTQASTDPHRPRALYLRGAYLDVLRALEALAETELDLVPLGLDLESSPVDRGPPRWVLVVQP